MKYTPTLLGSLLFLTCLCPPQVWAGDEACGGTTPACYPARAYSLWSCQACQTVYHCVSNVTGTIVPGSTCDSNGDPCDAYSTCRQFCEQPVGGGCTLNSPYLAECNTDPGHCEVRFQTQDCKWSGGTCTEPLEWLTWGCCGPGNATPTPVPAPTPTPTNQPNPTCTLSTISGSSTLTLGTSGSYSVTATPANGVVDRVEFTVSQTTTVITPATLIQDTVSPYAQTYTGNAIGQATIIAKCIMGGQIKDTKQLTVTVTAPTTTITANSYIDQDGQPPCNDSPQTPVSFTPTYTINPAAISGSNPFTVNSTPGNIYTVSVTGVPSEWIPVGGGNCGTSLVQSIMFNATNYSIPQTVNFYFTHRAEAWWQAAGGDVYAAAGATNTVPATATDPYTVTNLSGQPNSSGAIIAGTTNSVNIVGPNGRQWLVNTSPTQANNQKYNYFVSLLEVSNPTDGWTPNTDTTIDATHSLGDVQPTKTYDPPDKNKVYYHHGNLNINNLTVSSGQAVTLLVDGSLTVNTNITVAQGGFLAAIVTGDITFTENVTNAHGIYIADGRLIIANANNSLVGLARQFRGEGVFVGWSGVILNRKLNVLQTDIYENTNPAVIFRYRPDFIINAPESFKHSTIKWTEVAPR